MIQVELDKFYNDIEKNKMPMYIIFYNEKFLEKTKNMEHPKI